jgi:hypothetical protein
MQLQFRSAGQPIFNSRYHNRAKQSIQVRLVAPPLSKLIIRDFISLALIISKPTFNMTTVSTTVKIVVSMVVVAALVATTFNSKVRYRRNVLVYGSWQCE